MNQSEIFRVFMNHIWNEANTRDYFTYGNANEVAKAMGANIINGIPYSRQDGTNDVDTWHVWLFPDKSQCEVLEDGSGVDDPPEPTCVYDAAMTTDEHNKRLQSQSGLQTE